MPIPPEFRMNDRVTVTIENGIGRVRLDRPRKHNALDLAMFERIAGAQAQLRKQPGLRAVVLEAAGPDFSSGLDVGATMGNRRAVLKLMWKWLPWRPNLVQQVGVGWRRLPVPVVAAIRGRCWGGGLQIALGADFRIAAPDASLSVMESKWGLIPDMGGTLALRELLGRDQAMRLAMTAEILDGEAARTLGLVSAVHPDPGTAAVGLAAQLADRSPGAVDGIKRLYRQSWSVKSGGVLACETLYQWRIIAGANQRIAVRRQRGEDVPWTDA